MEKFPEHGRALLAIVLACTLPVLDGHAQSPSSGWTSGDVGSPVAAGATSIADGAFTVTGGGWDIWGRADQFQFVYQLVTGDVEIVARVASLTAADPWAKAGVMIRQSLAAGSPHASILGTAGSGWSAEVRKSSDGLTTDSSGPSGTPPGWVRLVRAGTVVTASHSYDGSTWSVVSSDTIAMSSNVYVGLVVTSHNSEGATARATFQNVSVRGTTAGLPDPTPTPLPGGSTSGWTSGDVGNPVAAGATSIANGTFTVTGVGSDIWGRADQFHFVYQLVTGDVEIVARVASLSATDPWAKAGVMIRQSLTAGSPHASILGTAGNGWSAEVRKSSDGLTTDSSGPSGTSPGWVRLVRAGTVVTASHSYDGSTWSVVSSDTIAMSSSVYVGLVVTSHNSEGAGAYATFQNVAVRGTIVGSPGPSPAPPALTPPALTPPASPSGWTSGDVGNPAAAGAATIADGTFTVTGGGWDIWGRADQFQFVYQLVTGDVEIVARVTSLSAADPWAKAGVMIRQSLTSGSPHVSLLGTAGRGWSAEVRRSSDGLTTDSSGPSGIPPGWVRLVRAGTVVTAYHSYDGSTWSVLSSDTIAMSSSVYVGLAVTGHDGDGATARATFQNVAVRGSIAPNQPPTVSLSSPAQGSPFTAPAAITFSAVAGDSDGSVVRVDFYSGPQLIRSDTSSPFSASWTNVPAGTYSLRAVATDDAGVTTTSSAIDVVVNASGIQGAIPTFAVFQPSSDHATVTSYSLSLHQAGQPTSAAPVATRDLGKPSVVIGEITVDISTLVAPLPTGSYYAVVSAIGPGGSSPSTPSPTFAK